MNRFRFFRFDVKFSTRFFDAFERARQSWIFRALLRRRGFLLRHDFDFQRVRAARRGFRAARCDCSRGNGRAESFRPLLRAVAVLPLAHGVLKLQTPFGNSRFFAVKFDERRAGRLGGDVFSLRFRQSGGNAVNRQAVRLVFDDRARRRRLVQIRGRQSAGISRRVDFRQRFRDGNFRQQFFAHRVVHHRSARRTNRQVKGVVSIANGTVHRF